MHGDAGRDGAARGENKPPLLNFDGIIDRIIMPIIMIIFVGNEAGTVEWQRTIESWCQEIG